MKRRPIRFACRLRAIGRCDANTVRDNPGSRVGRFLALANDHGRVRTGRELVEVVPRPRRRKHLPAPAQARRITPERQGKELLALAWRDRTAGRERALRRARTIDRGCRWPPEARMRLRYRRIGWNPRRKAYIFWGVAMLKRPHAGSMPWPSTLDSKVYCAPSIRAHRTLDWRTKLYHI
jgi:hypothetical protein